MNGPHSLLVYWPLHTNRAGNCTQSARVLACMQTGPENAHHCLIVEPSVCEDEGNAAWCLRKEWTRALACTVYSLQDPQACCHVQCMIAYDSA